MLASWMQTSILGYTLLTVPRNDTYAVANSRSFGMELSIVSLDEIENWISQEHGEKRVALGGAS